jgi:putative aldouronate transport system permease protein
MKKKNRVGTVFIYLIFIMLCLCILYPFFCVLSVSLSSAEDIKQYGFRVLPKHLDFSAYSYLFRDSKMLWQAYGTTIFVSVVGTAIGCLVTSLYAYAISRTTFRWRGVLSLFVTFTMFFSGGMAAQYITYVKLLNLKNSIWVLILPGAFSAMNTIIMRAYYEKLPYSMIESAKIDGASEYQIFWRMMFPLAKPALATICLTLFVAYWNAYYEAMMYMDTGNYVTIQLLLQRIRLSQDLRMIRVHSVLRHPREYPPEVQSFLFQKSGQISMYPAHNNVSRSS